MSSLAAVSGLREEAFFTPPGADRLFMFLHDAEPRDGLGIVLCHACAEEKHWAHRIYVNFGRSLAASGIPVLRYDVRGEGESTREFEDVDLATRVEDTVAAVQTLATLRPAIRRVVLLGHRVGSLVAAEAAARLGSRVAGLALWDPVYDGRDYLLQVLRQHLAAQMAVSGRVTTSREELLKQMDEGGWVYLEGYGFGGSFYRQLIASEWVRNAAVFERPVLIAEVGGTAGREGVEPPVGPRRRASVGDRRGLARGALLARDARLSPRRAGSRTRHPHLAGDAAPVNATVVVSRGPEGFGNYSMLDLPEGGSEQWDVACVLVSPGVKPRVAPHRLYRKLASEFTARGIPVLRLDFVGMGDSEGELPETAMEDVYRLVQAGRHLVEVRAAMDQLQVRYGVRRFLIGGLCGAAITGLLVAEGDPRVAGLFSIGMPVVLVGHESDKTMPLTESRLEAERQVIRNKALRLSTWARFLTFKSDYRLLWSVTRDTLARALPGSRRARRDTEGVAPELPPDLDPNFVRAFFRLADERVPSLLLFGSNDQHLWEYKDKFVALWERRIATLGDVVHTHVVEGANHILGDPAWISEARSVTGRWLDTHVLGIASHRAPELQIEEVRDEARFFELRAEWNDMLARSASNSVTLTWEWLTTWWQVYKSSRKLRVVLVREKGRLVGAAPMLLRQGLRWTHGLVPTRRLELLASGEAIGHQICSDYINWIAETGREAEITTALLKHFCDSRDWDEMILPDVPANSPAVQSLQAAARTNGLVCEELEREACPYIVLPGSWDDYLKSLGSSHRYRVRRALRDFEEAGGRYVVAETREEVERLMPILINLHQSRWTSKGEPGAFGSRWRLEFHQKLMPMALERGWLRLGVLFVGEEPIGAIYNLVYDGRVYFYQSGITPQESSTLRPGVLLHAHEIMAAVTGGTREYDFLKRGESQYKESWARESRDLVRLRIARHSMHDTATRLARRLRSRAGALKRRVQAKWS